MVRIALGKLVINWIVGCSLEISDDAIWFIYFPVYHLYTDGWKRAAWYQSNKEGNWEFDHQWISGERQGRPEDV